MDVQGFRLLNRGRDVKHRHCEFAQVVPMLVGNPHIDLSLVSDVTRILWDVAPASDAEPTGRV